MFAGALRGAKENMGDEKEAERMADELADDMMAGLDELGGEAEAELPVAVAVMPQQQQPKAAAVEEHKVMGGGGAGVLKREEPIAVAKAAEPARAAHATAEVPMGARRMGGVTESKAVDAAALKVWRTAVERYGNDAGLVALGEPVSVKTQVVSGTKYIFTFAGDKSATVWAQPWKDK